jgi:thioredoxin-related protein
MKYLLILLLFVSLRCLSQSGLNKTPSSDEGIHFVKELNWQQIKDKAKKENKYIFLDCYATWCGPCLYMKKDIFTKKEVGEYFNSNFICIEVQMDRTDKDDKYVKSWYKEADSISSLFSISSYPTYLFFTPDGIPIHRILGATFGDPQQFIEKASDVFNPQKSYYGGISEFRSHRSDSLYLRNEIQAALKVGDWRIVDTLRKIYFDVIKNLFDKQNIVLLFPTINSSSDTLFEVLERNIPKVNLILGNSSCEDRLINIVIHELIEPLLERDTILNLVDISSRLTNEYPTLKNELIARVNDRFRSYFVSEIRADISKDTSKTPHWSSIEANWVKRYPSYDFRQIFSDQKMRYYGSTGDWKECGNEAYYLFRHYGGKLSIGAINNICWAYIFLHVEDHKILKQGIYQMEIIVKNYSINEIFQYYDTYANLLYKIGDRRKAIYWEQEAINKCEEYQRKNDINGINSDLKLYLGELKKMIAKEPTWSI